MAARSSQPPDSNDGHSNAERRDADATLGSSQRKCGVAPRLPGGSGALSQTRAHNRKVRRNYAEVPLNTTANGNRVGAYVSQAKPSQAKPSQAKPKF